MLLLMGGRAFSAFRLAAVAQRLNTLAVAAPASAYGVGAVNAPGDALYSGEASAAIEAFYVYIVDAELAQAEVAQLMALLGDVRSDQAEAFDLLVLPRAGSLSPWSSKATEIAHNCGLPGVRRIERGVAWRIAGLAPEARVEPWLQDVIHDRMTERVVVDFSVTETLFEQHAPGALLSIDVLAGGVAQLAVDNKRYGFALSDEEMVYLVDSYVRLGRNPTDAELMMFAQANSEHCRHKIFNACWIIDQQSMPGTLFGMIRETHKQHPAGTLVAYDDNAAIIAGRAAASLQINPHSGLYRAVAEAANIQIKVETHNHPTAISPFAGAATGAGGEIRDEGATGLGARPKAGLCGFSVSNLRLPDYLQSWEQHAGAPTHIASALQIMLEGPIGAAAFNNEFGRPNLAGYFRTLEMLVHHAEQNDARWVGYHKPIMIAGGMGNVRPVNTAKKAIDVGSYVVVLGGPAMLIGLGGGAASSMASGQSDEALDFASVQRGNPEMQRRCQEVINQCVGLGDESPVLSIHDVGAGGLSNALPELVHDAGRGAVFDLRKIPTAETAMSPMEIWCNESQERYVLAIAQGQLETFEAMCARERCPYAVLGRATEAKHLRVDDQLSNQPPVDMSLDLLLGKPPRMQRNVARHAEKLLPLDFANHKGTTADAAVGYDIDIDFAVAQVLRLPAVAAKQFLITIGDRSVGGLVHRDQLVGPHQMPVADAAITLADFVGFSGEAMAIGERAPIAMINPQASGRMAVAEALTNIACAAVGDIGQVKLSANWMAAASEPGQDAALFDTVKAVTSLCMELGISIPVGKDSLSMKTRWQENPCATATPSDDAGSASSATASDDPTDHPSHTHGANHQDQSCHKSVVSPLSLIITAFSAVADVRKSRTPQLQIGTGDSKALATSHLLLIDLGLGKNRLGGSALAQVYGQVGDDCPDLVSAAALRGVFGAVQQALDEALVSAIHDRSDGGLFCTVAEMCFAGNCGVRLDLADNNSCHSNSLNSNNSRDLAGNEVNGNGIAGQLFSEELGLVLQVQAHNLAALQTHFDSHQVGHTVQVIGTVVADRTLQLHVGGVLRYESTIAALRKQWWETSFRMQKLRDNPICAEQEFARVCSDDDKGINPWLSFVPSCPAIIGVAKPNIAIVREQGVNGYMEMAAAFIAAGFEATDVHMSDIIAGRQDLSDYQGIAACGGFSYGDVLGAGRGWASSVLYNGRAADQFGAFFQRSEVFALGVCNGCQMFSHLRDLIPGAGHWPTFARNQSEQFEARVSTVEIAASASILFNGMVGSRIPVVVAHGEGRVQTETAPALAETVTLRYVDNSGQVTQAYPQNPNGSVGGITGLCNSDGRFNIMMPHPERVYRRVQNSWSPPNWGEHGPWLQMFVNAYQWVQGN